jgi:hypothetical protein
MSLQKSWNKHPDFRRDELPYYHTFPAVPPPMISQPARLPRAQILIARAHALFSDSNTGGSFMV